MISGLLAGGSPGFRIVLFCFTHFGYGDVMLVGSLLVDFTPYHARDDAMLSFLLQSLRLMNWYADHNVSFWFGCFLFGLFVVLVLVAVFVFGCAWWLFFGFCDDLCDHVLVLLQFTFEASQLADGHGYASLSQFIVMCNMQLNVFNDLARANRRGKEKTCSYIYGN